MSTPSKARRSVARGARAFSFAALLTMAFASVGVATPTLAFEKVLVPARVSPGNEDAWKRAEKAEREALKERAAADKAHTKALETIRKSALKGDLDERGARTAEQDYRALARQMPGGQDHVAHVEWAKALKAAADRWAKLERGVINARKSGEKAQENVRKATERQARADAALRDARAAKTAAER